MFIQDALDMFLVQLEADGRSTHTIAQYKRHVQALSTWLDGRGGEGRTQVKDVGHQDLALFLVSPVARKRSDGETKMATSTNCLRSSQRCFFRYLHETGMIDSNPARMIRHAKCGTPPPRAMSDAEQERLMKALRKAKGSAAERDHMLFALMLATGIRIGSALGLQARDVDLDGGELHLRRAKGNRPQVVFLGEKIRAQLGDYLDARSLTGKSTLFAGRGGRPMSTRHARRRFAGWIQAAGITREFSPHALRHSFGMAVYRKTGDLLIAKEALGHRSVASTLIYARASVTRLKEALGVCA